MLDLVLEAGHLENPFLSGNRFERRFTAEDEYDVACCDEDQFGEGFFDTGQEFAKGTDALANSLDRDPGFDESDGGLQCNEIFERVAVVAPRSSRRRLYQVGLRPVLELPSRNAEDLNDIATAEVFDRASHRRQGVRSSYFRGRCQSACGGGEGHWGGPSPDRTVMVQRKQTPRAPESQAESASVLYGSFLAVSTVSIFPRFLLSLGSWSPGGHGEERHPVGGETR